MIGRNNFATLVAAVALTLPLVSSAAEIKIGAGAAPTENVLKPVKEAFEKSSGIKLNVISSGPKIALQDLDRGSVDAAAAGLTLEDWVALMKKEGVPVSDPSVYHQSIIGKDRIVVIVHKDNPVAKLSKEQLAGIFGGTIQSWKDVGGKDMPVIVVWGKLIPGTNSLFSKQVLGDAAVTKDVLEVNTAADVKQAVSTNVEAIGIGPMAVVDATVRSPASPEISRPITLLTRGKPAPDVQRLLEFIAGEGSKLVKQ
jgi:phosphate transport system substrate-binding protein